MRPAMAVSSLPACLIGLPISRVRGRASSPLCAASRSLNRRRAASRSATGTWAQRGWPRRARAYLAAISAGVLSATSARASSVAGLTIFMSALTSCGRNTGAPGPGGNLLEEAGQQHLRIQQPRLARPHELRVPLYAIGEGAFRSSVVAHGLDHPVGDRARLHHQPAPQGVEPLVVHAVDPGRARAGVRVPAGQIRVGADLDLVAV